MQIAVGGRFTKVHLPKQDKKSTEVHAKRGKITRFSASSRMLLLSKFNSINQKKMVARRCFFITLTYPQRFPTPGEAKKELQAFRRRFERAYGHHAMFWKVEPQRRGAPHFHLLLCAQADLELAELLKWSAQAWYEIAGREDPAHLSWHLGQLGNQNRPCVEQMRDWKAAGIYCGKYCAKVVDAVDGWAFPGRWWGVWHEDLLPVEVDRQDVSRAVAVRARRVLVKWFQHQPSGRHQWRILGQVFRGFLKPVEAAKLKEAGHLVKSYCRQMRQGGRSGKGGCRVFVDESTSRRILEWARSEVALRVSRRKELDK